MYVIEFFYGMLGIKSEVSSINSLITEIFKTHYSPLERKSSCISMMSYYFKHIENYIDYRGASQ